MADGIESVPHADFRYSFFQRFGAGFLFALLCVMLAVMAGFSASLLAAGDLFLALFLLAMTAFFALMCRMLYRDFTMKTRWRVTLEPEGAVFNLPVWRLLFGPAAGLRGPLSYGAMQAVEWREEAIETMGLTTINRVYAIRLKSGGVILLGEDRPIPKTVNYTTLAGDAAGALARTAGVSLRKRPMAKADGGFLTLWGTARPAWPDEPEEAGLSEADERAIRHGHLLTQLIPVIAFAVVLVVSLL